VSGGFLMLVYFEVIVVIVIENLYNLNKEALQSKVRWGPVLRWDFVLVKCYANE
jgi:hypothetical protein